MSIKFSELTAKRVSYAIARRIADVPVAVSWHMPRNSARERIKQFDGIHKGERCFIVCNGPSLNKLDLTLLRNEYTFGMNRIYLLFKELGFETTYFVCSNSLVIDQFVDDIRRLEMPKFINWRRRHLFSDDDRSHFFKIDYSLRPKFSRDMTSSISECGTVTYVCLQLAYYMGFEEVVVVGADHSFAEKGIPNTSEVRSGARDESHFDPNYFPQGIKWQLPDLYRNEIGYRLARAAYEADGRSLVNATAGGKLELLERKSYASFF